MNNDQQGNKRTFMRKVGRQVQWWDRRAMGLMRIANERGAWSNRRVRDELEAVRKKMGETRNRLDGLRNARAEGWTDPARDVSASYRDLKEAIRRVESDLRPK